MIKQIDVIDILEIIDLSLSFSSLLSFVSHC